ncbi:hypothetical protein MPER_05146, partial [Moniliophthora perniciosa FA553]
AAWKAYEMRKPCDAPDLDCGSSIADILFHQRLSRYCLLFFTVTPMVARAQCSPDFGGRQVTIFNTRYGAIDKAWVSVTTCLAHREHREQRSRLFIRVSHFLDSPVTRLMTYDLPSPRDIDNSRVVLTRSGESLGMAPILDVNPNTDQRFNIICENCQSSAVG